MKKHIFICSKSMNIGKFPLFQDKNKYIVIRDIKKMTQVKKYYFTYIDNSCPGWIRKQTYNIKTKYGKGLLLDHEIQFKSQLHKLVLKKSKKLYKKYFLDQYDLSLKNKSILDKLDDNSLYIIKPIKSCAGMGNKVFKGKKGIMKHLEDNKNEKFIKSVEDGELKWVIQKYIENPLLLNGKKFHMRVIVLLANNNAYLYKTFAVFPSAKKYDKTNLDMKIHDSHGESSDPSEQKAFPEDFENMKNVKEIYMDIVDLIRGMKNLGLLTYKCYENVETCYSFLGFDIMITSDYKVKCIEINNEPGFHSTWKFTPHLTEGLIDLVILKKKEGKGYYNL